MSYTRVFYEINGITTSNYQQALALGWNEYINKPIYRECYEEICSEEDKEKHREAVRKYIKEKR